MNCHHAKSYSLLLKTADGYKREQVQGALISFTAHAFKKYLQQYDAAILKNIMLTKWTEVINLAKNTYD